MAALTTVLLPWFMCCTQLQLRVSRFSGALLGLTAWSYSSLKHAQPDLLTAIARRACQLAGQQALKPLDASQLVRAAAKLCFRDDQMFKACAGVSGIAVVQGFISQLQAGINYVSLVFSCDGCTELVDADNRAQHLLVTCKVTSFTAHSCTAPHKLHYFEYCL